MIQVIGKRLKALLKSQPRLHARVALLRDQYNERRQPTAEGKARDEYFRRYFERAHISPGQRRKFLLDFYR